MAGDPALLPLPVKLTEGMLALDVAKLGKPKFKSILVGKLKKAGSKKGASVSAKFKFSVPAGVLRLAAQGNYRYVIVAVDPLNRIAEGNATNNVVVVDLNSATAK